MRRVPLADDERRAGLLHRALHRRVSLLVKRRFDCAERRGVAGFEYGFGGFAPLHRIGRHESERAQRRIDRRAHAIVDAHGLQPAGERDELGSGQRVEALAALVLQDNVLIGGAVEKPAIGECREDGLRLLIPARGERGGRVVDLVEALCREAC